MEKLFLFKFIVLVRPKHLDFAVLLCGRTILYTAIPLSLSLFLSPSLSLSFSLSLFLCLALCLTPPSLSISVLFSLYLSIFLFHKSPMFFLTRFFPSIFEKAPFLCLALIMKLRHFGIGRLLSNFS